MRIGIGADQHGFRLKEVLKEYLASEGHEIRDYGVASEDPIDYPDVAERVARSVASGDTERGVLICGTGLGMAIAANKIPGIRAGTVSDPYSAERLAKSNDAQIICLGGRTIGVEVARMLVDRYLASEFQGGDSARKVAKIEALEHRGVAG